MRTPLCAVLAVLISGCGMFGGGEKEARLDAMEQQMAVVIERIGTIEETNEEIMENVEELAKDKSTSRRLTLLEEKQASVEKMQLEVISYQESLKGSLAKTREYLEALKKKVNKLASTQKGGVAESRRKRLEEKLRREIDEDVRIQEIPRDKIIKIERLPPPPAEEKKPPSPVKRKPAPPPKEEVVEEFRGGFILEDF